MLFGNDKRNKIMDTGALRRLCSDGCNSKSFTTFASVKLFVV